jgi:cation transport regulator ChaB
MAKKGQRKIGECVYCGRNSPLTKDHVIPRSLFVSPFPPNLITVPCCEQCNNLKSRDEDYLRDLLTTDIYANTHPIAENIFKDKVARSARRNSSEFAHKVVTSARSEPFYTRGGVYLGNVVAIPVDEIRMTGIFTRIVRGLYYEARKQRIPDNYIFKVWRYQPWDFLEALEYFKQMHMNGPRILGDVFGYAFLSVQEDPLMTLWLLWFYKRAFFSVSVGNPELIPR